MVVHQEPIAFTPDFSFFLDADEVIILDWFHLRKHCYEVIIMAIKGNKEYKHKVQAEFNRLIWIGEIDEAICYLEQIEENHIKNPFKMKELIDYLERKKRYVRCYALGSRTGITELIQSG